MVESSRMHRSLALLRMRGEKCKHINILDDTRSLMCLRWHDAVRTLAKFHRIEPQSIGLTDYGRHGGFYNRQIKTFSSISSSQAQAVDIETKTPVGKIPHYDATVAFLRDPGEQPRDRSSLIHGDYKIDNLVYHPREPRVIGILE